MQKDTHKYVRYIIRNMSMYINKMLLRRIQKIIKMDISSRPSERGPSQRSIMTLSPQPRQI